jgi:cytochrome c-type biogenesis protein CcmE
MKAKHTRLLWLLLSIALGSGGLWLAISAFSENMMYFYTPADIVNTPQGALLQRAHKPLRLGGLVASGSYQTNGIQHIFSVSDQTTAKIEVHYTGLLPSLFREGQGVVMEGVLNSAGVFTATRVLAKHDENYMPKEVADKLKQQGSWRGNK